uniref:Uncharacterized protein n=1 Tax=Kwoniella bestiolae CBS 10118 TaxID=1296100 RepID=A0A1B9GG77_9TREE|nr:hypothetical protein I302_01469 [Kwoniella bestiolae CBS 10118]OCF29955.1 hypothetical protein I302_01469 [Kwoniella bestiolae CBS 10118]
MPNYQEAVPYEGDGSVSMSRVSVLGLSVMSSFIDLASYSYTGHFGSAPCTYTIPHHHPPHITYLLTNGPDPPPSPSLDHGTLISVFSPILSFHQPIHSSTLRKDLVVLVGIGTAIRIGLEH